MIICSNCGATNNEANGNICRKCGALLPVSIKPPRVKIHPETKKTTKSKNIKPQSKSENKTHLDLQEIPHTDLLEESDEEKDLKDEEVDKQDRHFEEDDTENDDDYLKEIAPTPFQGSIITEKNVYGSLIPRKKESKKLSSNNSSTIVRQKRLEEDMTKVLKFLSNKITVKQLPVTNTRKKQETKLQKEEKLPPASMNEILRELLKLDLNIEASAIIKSDGTILASAVSSRVTDTLFGTIGQNLSMIGTDIINGLSAGKLQSISLKGTKGVLDLAPITKTNDMFLLIFSNPKIKSGIIFLAAKMVQKQVKEYLGI